MAALRTQVYFTQRQREALDKRARAERKTLAEVVRDAIDAYLATKPDPDEALAQTFGALPSLEVPPRSEWDRG